MSQETQINNLGGGISDEDSKLVDSILNDLNQGSPQQQAPQQQQQQQQHQQQQQQQQHQQQQQGQQQGGLPPGMTEEQYKMMMMQRQQQMVAQQQQQHNMMKQNMIKNDSPENIIDSLRDESKNIGLVVLLALVMNLEQVNGLFKMVSVFKDESGLVNMQGLLVKALLVGVIYYLVKRLI
jgi:uncharacterized membrane protein